MKGGKKKNCCSIKALAGFLTHSPVVDDASGINQLVHVLGHYATCIRICVSRHYAISSVVYGLVIVLLLDLQLEEPLVNEVGVLDVDRLVVHPAVHVDLIVAHHVAR